MVFAFSNEDAMSGSIVQVAPSKEELRQLDIFVLDYSSLTVGAMQNFQDDGRSLPEPFNRPGQCGDEMISRWSNGS